MILAVYFSDVCQVFGLICMVFQKISYSTFNVMAGTESHLVCTVKARSVDSDNVMCSSMVRCNVVHSGTGTGSKTEVETV